MDNETKFTQKESFIDKAMVFFKSKKWKEIWDKITTGILIALLATPFLILTYIIVWFLSK
jgi:hypothetical protein